MKLFPRLLIALALLFSAPALAVAAVPSIPPSAPATITTLQRALGPQRLATDAVAVSDSRDQNALSYGYDASSGNWQGLQVSQYNWCDLLSTAGTGTLTFTAAGQTVTWKAPGDPGVGASTALTTGYISIPSSVPATYGSLLLEVRNLTAMPGSNQTVTVTCGTNRSRYKGWRTDKGTDLVWLFSTLRWPNAGVRDYSIGGATTADLLEGIAYYNTGTYACATTCEAFFQVGTNDITNNVTTAVAEANKTAIYDAWQKVNPGRHAVILGEYARWASSGPPTTLTGAQCTQLQAFNAFDADQALKRGWLFVPRYEITVDTAYTDCRPRTDIDITDDGVHLSAQGGQFLGQYEAGVIGQWFGYGPASRQTDANLWSYGNIVGTSGTFGTGCSGTLPTNWKAAFATGTGTCTTAILNTRSDGAPGQAVQLVGQFTACSNLPSATCLLQVASNGGTTLANLGLAVGDTITIAIDYNIVSATHLPAIEVFAQFVTTSPQQQVFAICDCGTTSNTASYLGTGFGTFYSPSFTIPTGTTQINLYIWVRGVADTAVNIEFAGWKVRKETTKAGPQAANDDYAMERAA